MARKSSLVPTTVSASSTQNDRAGSEANRTTAPSATIAKRATSHRFRARAITARMLPEPPAANSERSTAPEYFGLAPKVVREVRIRFRELSEKVGESRHAAISRRLSGATHKRKVAHACITS